MRRFPALQTCIMHRFLYLNYSLFSRNDLLGAFFGHLWTIQTTNHKSPCGLSARPRFQSIPNFQLIKLYTPSDWVKCVKITLVLLDHLSFFLSPRWKLMPGRLRLHWRLKRPTCFYCMWQGIPPRNFKHFAFSPFFNHFVQQRSKLKNDLNNTQSTIYI